MSSSSQVDRLKACYLLGEGSRQTNVFGCVKHAHRLLINYVIFLSPHFLCSTAAEAVIAAPKAALTGLVGANLGAVKGIMGGAAMGAAIGATASDIVQPGALKSMLGGLRTLNANVKVVAEKVKVVADRMVRDREQAAQRLTAARVIEAPLNTAGDSDGTVPAESTFDASGSLVSGGDDDARPVTTASSIWSSSATATAKMSDDSHDAAAAVALPISVNSGPSVGACEAQPASELPGKADAVSGNEPALDVQAELVRLLQGGLD